MALTAEITLASAQKRPACITCTKAKRRCSKQLPACDRCRIKNLQCVYLVTTAQAFNTAGNHSIVAAAVTPSDSSSEYQVDAAPFQAQPTSERIQRLTHNELPWFLEPDSWLIDHIAVEADNQVTYPESGLHFFLQRMKLWLDQWTKENHCVFIHSRLYGADLPSHLQYAHAAWLSYSAASTSTSKMIALKTATAWSRNLVQEQSIHDTMGTSTLDVLSHLSRTQALLIFQMIGLFDGDIRARAEAETLSITLINWADTLMQAAGVESGYSSPPRPEEQLNTPQIKHLRSDHTVASQWRAWILSESIRRTWILATLTEAAYLIMKQGLAMCPGSIAFNGRSGLWDAMSPHAWLASSEKHSTTKMPVFCRGLSQLLDDGIPSDVDEFTQALLAYGNGRERLEDWLSGQ